MKKYFALLIALIMIISTTAAFAEGNPPSGGTPLTGEMGTPPDGTPPDGFGGGGTPPSGEMGTPTDGTPPDGFGGGQGSGFGGGTPPGGQSSSFEYTAATEITEAVKRVVSPFILRRLKTDRNIISDLPDKIETTDYVELTRKQTVLYNKEVLDLAEKLESGPETGIARKGLVLQSISRFKQICNHPDQYLGQDEYAMAESGKMQVLCEICETIRDKRERVLVFTQYKEITSHLDALLEKTFGRRGLIISGDVSARERTRLVEQFNGEAYVPYMVLTIKAGGTGLNLTRANHVVLFDRWWNPAVENQAIDRAFRIGQTKDVMVHKFITRDTIEEKIAELIESKEQLARDVVSASSGETWLTEMTNQEILNLVRLEG